MMNKQDAEVLIAITWEQAKMIQNALLVLGRKSRDETRNEDESDWYREQWQNQLPKVTELYKGITNQIDQHEEDFSQEGSH